MQLDKPFGLEVVRDDGDLGRVAAMALAKSDNGKQHVLEGICGELVEQDVALLWQPVEAARSVQIAARLAQVGKGVLGAPAGEDELRTAIGGDVAAAERGADVLEKDQVLGRFVGAALLEGLQHPVVLAARVATMENGVATHNHQLGRGGRHADQISGSCSGTRRAVEDAVWRAEPRDDGGEVADRNMQPTFSRMCQLPSPLRNGCAAGRVAGKRLDGQPEQRPAAKK